MTDPVELASRHSRERAASGLSKSGQLIAATAATMIVEFAATLADSATETCGAEAEAVSRLFLRQAAEMLLMSAEVPDETEAVTVGSRWKWTSSGDEFTVTGRVGHSVGIRHDSGEEYSGYGAQEIVWRARRLAEPCQGECGVEAHRHLIAVGPDGTRIYRGSP